MNVTDSPPVAQRPCTAERARAAIVFATSVAARRPSGQQWIERLARGGHANRMLAEATEDHELVNVAVDEADSRAMQMAAAPSGGPGDIALKLARLVADLLQDFDGYPGSVQMLALAASALADTVTLASGAIELPPGAVAGVADDDEEAIARWCAIGEEMMRP